MTQGVDSKVVIAEAPPDSSRTNGRGRILEAALELFTLNGYQSVTVGELCRSAGVVKADFFANFDSTYAVLKQLYDDITQDVITGVQRALDDAPTGLLDYLYVGMRAYMHTMVDDPRRALLAGVEVLGVDARLDAERRDARVLFADFFAQLSATYQDNRVIPGGLTNLSYMALSAAIFEMAVTYALSPVGERPSFDVLTAEAVHFMKSVIETPLI